ncbi:hypothetical protein [Photobacterium phosphoreum]|uniref:hypothetical protein n=1 Tax=Photobacterium phosphoreum TaxID=659 RepID=UPI0039F69E69
MLAFYCLLLSTHLIHEGSRFPLPAIFRFKLLSRVHHGTPCPLAVPSNPPLSSRVHHGTQKELLFIDSDKLSSRVHHGTPGSVITVANSKLSSRVHHGTLKVSSNILHFFNMLPENINFTPFLNLCFLSSINQGVTNAKKIRV